MRFPSLNIVVFLIAWVLLSVPVSCSKKDQPASASVTGIQQYSLFPGRDVTTMDLAKHTISVRVPDSILAGTTLTASFSISTGASLSVDGQAQQSGITKNNFESDLRCTLTAA